MKEKTRQKADSSKFEKIMNGEVKRLSIGQAKWMEMEQRKIQQEKKKKNSIKEEKVEN